MCQQVLTFVSRMAAWPVSLFEASGLGISGVRLRPPPPCQTDISQFVWPSDPKS